MLIRVSGLESFRRWRLDDELPLGDLLSSLTSGVETEAMRRGTALHKALELAQPGEHESLSALGYTFNFAGGAVAVPSIREVRAYGRYGDLTVTGQTDGLDGVVIVDHKTTTSFDAEKYLAGYQWRFYLDLFHADVFRWQVFEVREEGEGTRVYRVGEPHILTAYRYPDMRHDCEALAADFLTFARDFLPADFGRMAA
jgi:hypothetical protein